MVDNQRSNKRLVQFAPERDPWLGIMTKDSHLNQMRLEVHLPPGREIGSEKSDFDINTSKSVVNLHYSLMEALRKWAAKPGAKKPTTDKPKPKGDILD